ncbi:sugar-binding domain-containing protein [Pseudokineococcus sp. 5B2Z-1]|uniref:sugar-binding transcriptional regulator n=1 Tax=Pseudokineococcus sp. 5B2Z-1 TaxID=3132744 RepID=UPI0030A041CF
MDEGTSSTAARHGSSGRPPRAGTSTSSAPRPGGHPPGPTGLVLLGEVARRFHVVGDSKVAIAADLGISRFKVARLLEEAAERGVVRVSVVVPGGTDPERSVALAAALGLERAVVVEVPTGDDVVVREHLGQAVAGLLEELLVDGEVLGLTWSRTLAHAAQALERLPPCTVVQLAGALHDAGSGTVELVRRVAAVSRGRALPVYAPLVTADAETATALRRDPGIRAALRRVDDLTTAVVAVGGWGEGLSTIWPAVAPHEREAGRRDGAVAEISGRLLDADGHRVPSAFDDRVMALELSQLEGVGEVVAVAYGAERTAAVLAAVRTGWLTTLVADAELADALLQLPPEELPGGDHGAGADELPDGQGSGDGEGLGEGRGEAPADPSGGGAASSPGG